MPKKGETKDLRDNAQVQATHDELTPILRDATLSKETFDLKTVSVGTNGSLYIKCKFKGLTSCGTMDEIEIKPKDKPHPDLMIMMQNLREYVALSYKQLAPFLLVEPVAKKLDKKLHTQLNKMKKDVINGIEVYKITIGGVNEKRGVSITGRMKTLNDEKKDGVTTPRIVFEDRRLGIEEDVENFTNLVIEEVEKFLFENKKAQGDLFQDVPPVADKQTTEEANAKEANFEVKDAKVVKA